MGLRLQCFLISYYIVLFYPSLAGHHLLVGGHVEFIAISSGLESSSVSHFPVLLLAPSIHSLIRDVMEETFPSPQLALSCGYTAFFLHSHALTPSGDAGEWHLRRLSSPSWVPEGCGYKQSHWHSDRGNKQYATLISYHRVGVHLGPAQSRGLCGITGKVRETSPRRARVTAASRALLTMNAGQYLPNWWLFSVFRAAAYRE